MGFKIGNFILQPSINNSLFPQMTIFSLQLSPFYLMHFSSFFNEIIHEDWGGGGGGNFTPG